MLTTNNAWIWNVVKKLEKNTNYIFIDLLFHVFGYISLPPTNARDAIAKHKQIQKWLKEKSMVENRQSMTNDDPADFDVQDYSKLIVQNRATD